MKEKNETAVTEKGVVVAGTQAVATYQEPFDDGFGELAPSDVRIPRLIIVQPQVKGMPEEAVGKLHINITGDFWDNLTVCPMKMVKTRICFPKEYDEENEPLCRSHDNKNPANDILNATPLCDSCELLPKAEGEKRAKYKCQYANWTTTDKGKSKPPQCQETYNYLLVDLESYMPMWGSFKSTAVSAAVKITSSLKILCQAKKVGMWGMQFDIATQKDKNGGNFYLPVLSSPVKVGEDHALSMAEIREQVKHIMPSDSAEQEAPDVSGAPPVKTEDPEEF
jgi:hypothetical protein